MASRLQKICGSSRDGSESVSRPTIFRFQSFRCWIGLCSDFNCNSAGARKPSTRLKFQDSVRLFLSVYPSHFVLIGYWGYNVMWLSTPKLVSTSFKTQSLEVLKLKYLSICEKMLDCERNKHRRVRGHCRPCTLQEKIGGSSNMSLSFH